MKKIQFSKMVASGNDFVVVKDVLYASGSMLQALAKKMCDRKYGIGADGLLVLEKSRLADIRMRIFNADGSEARMCGNGARCVARYTALAHATIETGAGIIEARISGDKARIKLTEPKDIALDLALDIAGKKIRVNFIDTGVPHVVIFVQGLEKINVAELGRKIRYHKKFSPQGTNVNFIEVTGNNSLGVRTYERGVEDETLACGTGSVASALIFALKSGLETGRVDVRTQGQEILEVTFTRQAKVFKDVWLEGEARIVYKGEYYV